MSRPSISAWRTTLRLARRDALRSKGRTALVVALIGLPVLALSSADVIYRTYQLDPGERIARELGSAQAEIQFYGGGVVKQGPSGFLGNVDVTGSSGVGIPLSASPSSVAATVAAITAQLPAGSRLLPVQNYALEIKTAIGLKAAESVGLDYSDPALTGLVRQVSGRAPHAADEVAITSRLASSTRLAIGSTMSLSGVKDRFRVVGIVADEAHNHAETAYFQPGAVPLGDGDYTNATHWYVASPAPINWSAVLRLNQSGYAVLSRSVYLNPPPKSEIPELNNGSTSSSTQTVTAVSLVIGMALLEIVLLAGPAFAVGARRQRRDLALIAAAGGSRSQLRNVVLSNGIVLGLLAGITGAVGAVGAVAIGLHFLRNVPDQVPGHFDLHFLELVGLALVALVTALLAAVFPARAAARTDVTAALAGRRGIVRTPKRVIVLGIVLAVVGAALALGGFTARTSTNVILGGVALTELGLICCTPALLGLAARVGRLLPLAPRIALRDAGRNRSAAAPAVAAVMASMIGAIALAAGVSSTEDHNRRNYQAGLPNNYGFVSTRLSDAFGHAVSVPPEQVAAVLRADLPVTDTATVHGVADPCEDFYGQPADPAQPKTCTSVYLQVASAGTTLPSLGSPSYSAPVVDDGRSVDVLFGTAMPAAKAALAAGRMVVTDPAYVRDGQVTIQRRSQLIGGPTGVSMPDPVETDIKVPATLVTGGLRADIQILPPALLPKLGVTSEVAGVVAAQSSAPTDQQLQRARGDLSRLASDAQISLQVETGYHNGRAWLEYGLVGIAALIAIGSALIATALANVDSRGDLVTLGSIGASPRTRRVLSMSRSGVIAGIGSVLGSAAGVIAAEAYVRASNASAAPSTSAGVSGQGQVAQAADHALRLVLPWAPLVLAAIGVPVVAAVVAGVFTRSRLSSEQRSA